MCGVQVGNVVAITAADVLAAACIDVSIAVCDETLLHFGVVQCTAVREGIARADEIVEMQSGVEGNGDAGGCHGRGGNGK